MTEKCLQHSHYFSAPCFPWKWWKDEENFRNTTSEFIFENHSFDWKMSKTPTPSLLTIFLVTDEWMRKTIEMYLFENHSFDWNMSKTPTPSLLTIFLVTDERIRKTIEMYLKNPIWKIILLSVKRYTIYLVSYLIKGWRNYKSVSKSKPTWSNMT